jgi:pimeloyl-[acyl-carrier protein] methyl ester esterase
MTRPTLLLLHGWGFDAQLWDPLAERLPGYRLVRWDRGYFGETAEPAVEAPVAAIGHSLGAMLLADRISTEMPLIAINGFDRFTGEGASPRRIVDRMIARFAQEPDTVLNDFRQRCGAPPVKRAIFRERLADDLALLAWYHSGPTPKRILALQGGEDPILPPSLRKTAFAGAARMTRADGGHLLPVTHAAWCAEQIEAFLCR